MRDVRKNDSGEYHFRFVTNTTGGRFSGRPGVILNVPDLQVRASPSSPSEGQTLTLTCSSACILPNSPTYIWYRNGEPVTNKPTKYNKLYLESASSEDIRQYSCALGSRGPEHSEVLKLVAVTANVSLTVTLTVSLTVILITGSVLMWFVIRRRRAAERDTDVQTEDDTYTALNPVTMSSDYDTLTNVTGATSDTYSTLNPATMASDYDTLTNVTGAASDTYSTLNPATMTSDYDTLTNVTGAASDTYSTLNPATMASDYDTLTYFTGFRNERR
ncbi:uncharacterized protein LOC118826713 [Colossoma macropomum]|uniref:uncharacterized protein LOC118826713 n=1 Tax=Colossoma macropomum TaxID=42526 RepID=UPI001864AEED|nr:uncharacterized protein LOC118826713 [Colossoma macropomum]